MNWISFAKINLLIYFTFISGCFYGQQWYALPNAASLSLPGYPAPYPPFSTTLPVNIIPVSNKTILLNSIIMASPSSGGSTNTYISKNDLQSIACYNNCSYTGTYGCCGIDLLNSYDDSTFSYISRFQNWYRYVINFRGKPAQGVACPQNNSIIVSASIAKNNAYCVSFLDYTNDTILIARVENTSPLTQLYTKLPGYTVTSGNRKLHFINDSVGYLSVYYKSNLAKSALLKTDNFGASWSEIYLDSVNKIVDYHFPSENVGYLLLNNGTIVKTLNKGTNWSPILNSGIMNLNCVNFSNDSIGYIAGDINVLKKTINGGVSWSNEISNTSGTISSIYTFADTAYFLTNDKLLYKNSPIIYDNVHEYEQSNELSVFPLPADNVINIAINSHLFSTDTYFIEIYDILGQQVYRSEEYDYNNKSISIEQLKSGTYSLVLKSDKKRVSRKLIVLKG